MNPRKAFGDALTEAQIVDAAREIIAEGGIAALTMRALSDRLGVALGATYHHVPTKRELLSLVGRSLFDSVTYPDTEDDWAAWVRAVMVDLGRIVSSYPGISTYLLEHIDEAPPIELNLRMGALLVRAGFTVRSTTAIMGSLTFLLSGAAAAGIPARPNPAFASIDMALAFEDGIDLLLSGARRQLEVDRAVR
jgi:AcrR family transcriptional regulator